MVVDRLQRYAIMVTDSGLASQVSQYRWQFSNNDTDEVHTTSTGYFSFTPSQEGMLHLSVELKNGSDSTITSLQIQQEVIAPNSDLESLIEQNDEVAPTAGHPDTSREIINDYRAYIDLIAPRDLDEDSTLNRLLFSISYLNALEFDGPRRAAIGEEIVQGLEDDDQSIFLHYAESGIGICGVRPFVLAMYLTQNEGGSSPILAKRELPNESSERQPIIDTLLSDLQALDQNILIDLFNVLRFPKANIKMCKELLDGLKTDYFNSDSYSQIVTDRAKGSSFIEQFKDGPFALNP